MADAQASSIPATMGTGGPAAPEPVPQSEPLSEDQVLNNAGGFVFKVDDFTLLRRFIILGSDGKGACHVRLALSMQQAEFRKRMPGLAWVGPTGGPGLGPSDWASGYGMPRLLVFERCV